jgi:hypothetical protein
MLTYMLTYAGAQALAKIGVSTDPHLFSHAAANDMVP